MNIRRILMVRYIVSMEPACMLSVPAGMAEPTQR